MYDLDHLATFTVGSRQGTLLRHRCFGHTNDVVNKTD